ncbi:MAG TPA: D-alanine--D-alanine ligase [Bdellovibrionales bacterium]|nr:D-alanine--D-alanine ligase [Bdellovibrionales bacterium]
MAQKKLRVAIVFGGKSGEHEVSITSAVSVFNALDKSKYEVVLVGIDKGGRWLLPSETKVLAHAENPRLLKLNKEKELVSLVPYESNKSLIRTEPSASGDDATSGKFDVIIPILHGTYGEDGTIQGLLEMSGIPYVGSGVLGSAVGMDKDVSRRLLKAAGIPVVPTLVFKKFEFAKNKQAAIQKAIKEFGFPFFVKPANMGSSVGVSKVKSEADALEKFELAFAYDNKILAEKGVEARELECSVLGNDEPKASIVGEIIPQHEFYSYEAKYMDENGALLEIPAKNVTADIVKRIQDLSIHAFKVLECAGMARVDFFLDRKNGELYLNEINTIPGFTKISMYPKLWEATGLPYSKLLDELVRFAIERHAEKTSLKTSYDTDEEC